MDTTGGKSLCDKLLQRLLIEFGQNDKSGVYAFTQYTMAYNSNKIEGSRLSEEHTAFLFNTMSLYSDMDVFKAKDIEEAQGHFLMFNKALNNIDKPLSEQLILSLHYELKSGVFEDRANGYAIGEYKKRRNIVYNVDTSSPEEVPLHMKNLLEWYNTQSITVDILAEFHCRYERIHPFQDGNGRTGRMILYRECLRNGIIPIIIKDTSKEAYMLALNLAQKSGDCSRLSEVFRDEQAWYYEKMQYFLTERS